MNRQPLTRRVVRKVAIAAMLAFAIFPLWYAFLACFCFDIDTNTGVICDGLGRELKAAPVLMRIVFDVRQMWPGIWWQIFDLIVFFGCYLLAYFIGCTWSKLAYPYNNDSSQEEQPLSEEETKAFGPSPYIGTKVK